MVYFPDAQIYLHQSSLLLEARPTTTRITTRYRISKAKVRKQRSPETSTPAASPAAPNPRASLVFKTYCPVSGVCLKYRTTKHYEVGRLMEGLGRCARTMAALPMLEAKTERGQDEEGGAGIVGVQGREAETAGAAAVVASMSAGQVLDTGKTKGSGGKKKKGKR